MLRFRLISIAVFSVLLFGCNLRPAVIPGTYNARFIFPNGYKGVAKLEESNSAPAVDKEAADFDIVFDANGVGQIHDYKSLVDPKNPGGLRVLRFEYASGQKLEQVTENKPNLVGVDWSQLGNHSVFVGTYNEMLKSGYKSGGIP